jgi:hypothetical protein
MPSFLEKFNSLEPAYKWGVVWLFLEALYILYWFIAMFIIVFGSSSEAQRTFHAFLAVHIVTLPAVLLYIMETRNKKRYYFVIWVLLAGFFLDLYGIIDANVHFSQSIPIGTDTSYRLVLAAAIIAPCISFLIIVWYITVLCMNSKKLEKTYQVFEEGRIKSRLLR